MKNHHPQAPAKSKTALRRGTLSAGQAVGRQFAAPRPHLPTTYAEQAMLFAEAASKEPVPSERPVD